MQKRCIIKGRFVFAVICFACIAAALWFFLLQSDAQAVTRAETASVGLNEYRYDLVFLPDNKMLNVTMELRYTNTTGDTLSSLLLRTYANAYASEETSPAAIDYFYDGSYKNGFSAGSLTLEGVWWNDQIVADWRYADEAKTALSVPVGNLLPGESGTLLLRCRIIVPECAHRFGYSDGVWQFGNALPILSRYESGQWRMDPYCAVGDPFVSDCANYTVALTAPKGYLCAAGAKTEMTETTDGVLFKMRGLALRDFAFALSKKYITAEDKVNGVTVTAYAFSKSDAKAIAKYGAKAVQVFSSLYGDYAWDHLAISLIDFPAGGMEYPGIFFLGSSYTASKSLRTAMELVIAHETAHQWFYALVGSDQYHQPWQDEALSEWAMLQYVKEIYNRSSYENMLYTRIHAPMQENILARVTPGSPVDHFGSYSDYSTVVYGRGAALMEAIDTLTGKANDFLRSYCDTFAFGFASREDFDAHLNKWSQMDLTPLVLDYIDTYMN